jgi:hypothetical protein
MEIGFFHLKLRLPKSKILPENGRISPKKMVPGNLFVADEFWSGNK